MPKKGKIKNRLYLVDYIEIGFVPSPSNIQLPACLLCKKILTNEAVKPSWLQDHLSVICPDKANKLIKFFQALKKNQTRSPNGSVFAQKVCQSVKTLIVS